MAARIQQPSSNPFASGAIVVDTTPFLQYEMQQRAKRQAQEDTLDEYYRNALKDVNTAGVRLQEQQIINDIAKERTQFYLQNRDKLKKGDLAAQTQFDRYTKDILEVANSSKPLLDVVDKVYQFKKSANYGVVGWDDILKNKIPKHEQPTFIRQNGQLVKNPNHQKINLYDLEQEQKPFGQEDLSKIVSFATAGLDKRTISQLPLQSDIAGKKKFEVVKGFDTEGQKALYDRVFSSVSNNARLDKFFDGLPRDEKNRYVTKAIQRHGLNILDQPNAQDYIQAEYVLEQIPQTSKGVDYEDIPRPRKGKDEDETDNWIENVVVRVREGGLGKESDKDSAAAWIKKLHTGSNPNYYIQSASQDERNERGTLLMAKGRSVTPIVGSDTKVRLRIVKKDEDSGKLIVTYPEYDLGTREGVYELAREYQRMTGKDTKFQRGILTGKSPSKLPTQPSQPAQPSKKSGSIDLGSFDKTKK